MIASVCTLLIYRPSRITIHADHVSPFQTVFIFGNKGLCSNSHVTEQGKFNLESDEHVDRVYALYKNI